MTFNSNYSSDHDCLRRTWQISVCLKYLLDGYVHTSSSLCMEAECSTVTNASHLKVLASVIPLYYHIGGSKYSKKGVSLNIYRFYPGGVYSNEEVKVLHDALINYHLYVKGLSKDIKAKIEKELKKYDGKEEILPQYKFSRAQLGQRNLLKLIIMLSDGETYTLDDIAEMLHVSRKTANNYMDDLVIYFDYGVSRVKGHKRGIYLTTNALTKLCPYEETEFLNKILVAYLNNASLSEADKEIINELLNKYERIRRIKMRNLVSLENITYSLSEENSNVIELFNENHVLIDSYDFKGNIVDLISYLNVRYNVHVIKDELEISLAPHKIYYLKNIIK